MFSERVGLAASIDIPVSSGPRTAAARQEERATKVTVCVKAPNTGYAYLKS